MSSTTAMFAIPKPDGTDPVRDGDDTMRALAERIDYMLGETGDDTISVTTAGTGQRKVISFARTYKTAPRVLVSLGRNGAGGMNPGTQAVWVETVTTTTVTIAANRASIGAVEFTWTARPKRTDVTP